MHCPFCGFLETKVVDTRSSEDGSYIRRRRECGNCGKRFTTYEKIEDLPLMVIKKDGSRQVFDSSKILKGLIKSCEKRSVPLKKLEEITMEIEREIRNSMEREISSIWIGELVMEKLKSVDEVAYVRFASVYREFKDLSTFKDEIENLLKRNS